MRITLVISNLGTGGAERVLSIMANYWAMHDQAVTLITIGSKENDWFVLSPRISRIAMNLETNSRSSIEAIRHNMQRLKRLRGEIRASHPDVVISFMDMINVLTLLACTGLGIPVIISERTDPAKHSIGMMWRILRSLLYRRADAVVMQSQGLRAWAARLMKDSSVRVIPNPVERPLQLSSVSCAGKGTKTIAAMGRLTRIKGYDVLLRAFAQCALKHSDWSLIILGEGPERRSLEALIQELGIEDRVHLPGRIRDPRSILQNTDLFVVSSFYEGFPNALLEAMACGAAVIATDCTVSMREIIHDGVNGVLVPSNDSNALASAMDRLMLDQAERKRLGSSAVDVVDHFGVDTVMSKWNALLGEFCQVSKIGIPEVPATRQNAVY